MVCVALRSASFQIYVSKAKRQRVNIFIPCLALALGGDARTNATEETRFVWRGFANCG